jgi:3-phosphoshikimate 1-carboxyvinyltransferase
MRAVIHPHRFSGVYRIPASKSHTVRRLFIAAMTDGISRIDYPLDSLDTRSCLEICRALGAFIEEHRGLDPQCPNPPDDKGEKLLGLTVHGIGRDGMKFNFSCPKRLDVGNSGTTLYLGLAIAALGDWQVEFTGDEQIRRRSAGPLLEALAGLGVRAVSAAGNGCAPITIQGPWKGGKVNLPCPTSQYLSAILLAAPLAPAGVITEVEAPLLNERPYIELTLSYLKAQHVSIETVSDFSWFRIQGGSAYKPVNGPVPGDFSSAAFPACAAAVSGGTIRLLGLDPEDPQGDKAYFNMLSQMGCKVEWQKKGEWELTASQNGKLNADVFDLNATPDLLPAMAAAAAYAQGETVLGNVAHARIKETDRIAVMADELKKLGVDAIERPDGLVIRGGGKKAAEGQRPDNIRLEGHGDHRVIMALAAAALGATCPVEISGAESADVTYPGFLETIGAELRP